MLKRRIIPKFLLKGGRLVKGVRFHGNFREAGNAVTTAKVYDAYGVDELILLDIEASSESRVAIADTVTRVAQQVFMPLTVGGGVRSLDDVNVLLRAGADKIAINTAAVEQQGLVTAAARTFGDQCITVSIDYAACPNGRNRVFTHGGRQATDLDPLEWALRMQDSNCGEILLTSIDRDGMMGGYDLEMIQAAAERLEIPVIASSGAGSLDDCMDVLRAGASAIAIGSLFLFTDHSPIKVRSFLRSNGFDVRASRTSRN